MATNKLSIITKESELFGQVRFTIIDEKEYAVGIDVAKALGYADASKTISTKCKGVTKMVMVAYFLKNYRNNGRKRIHGTC